jgi:predicted RNA-binding protein (virulence factor B family)
MPKLYQTNTLSIIEVSPDMVCVDGGKYGPLPLWRPPEDVQVGDEVEAFVYSDVSDKIVATMAKSYVQAGECSFLQVVSTGSSGTFLDCGLPKDLLLPLSEQAGNVREGDFYPVYVYQDEEGRPIASMKLHRHLNELQGDLTKGEQVDLMIVSETDLGFKAVINNQHLGLVFHSELSQPLELGEKRKGWIKDFRQDGKINLNINALDDDSRDELELRILRRLERAEGKLFISDKSTPEAIYDVFSVSKGNFKRALGNLYRQRLIHITADHIELADIVDMAEGSEDDAS